MMPVVMCQNVEQTPKYIFNTETAMCEVIPSNHCGMKDGNEFESMNECEETCGGI